MLARNIVDKGGANPEKIMPGDVVGLGENIAAGIIATVGTGVLSGSAIATGLILRSGSTANYADTFDSAVNIVAACAGNLYAPESVQGSSFRLLVINTVAFSDTVAVVAGSGTVFGPSTSTTAIAASTWREYNVTLLNTQAANITQGNVVSASNQILFVFQGVTSAYGMGPSGQTGRSFTVGATVTGTGIPTGTTVAGLLTNGSGIYGVVLSANATATNNNVALTFGPTVQIDGLRSGPL